jgi:hypothetical protein
MYLVPLLEESIFVGFYCYILYYLLNSYLPIFWIGFIKHFLGYYLGLQTLYCSRHGRKKSIITKRFLIDCLYEGLGFSILFYILKNAFVVGVVFHLLSEYIGIHKLFIKYRCK